MTEAALRLLDGLEGKIGGDGGEDIELPWKVLPVGAGWHLELNEMSHRRGDHGLIVLEKLGVAGFSLLLEFAKSLGEGFRKIGGDRGFLGNDECFGHGADLGGEEGVWEGISFGELICQLTRSDFERSHGLPKISWFEARIADLPSSPF